MNSPNPFLFKPRQPGTALCNRPRRLLLCQSVLLSLAMGSGTMVSAENDDASTTPANAGAAATIKPLPWCLRETGSHLPRNASECVAATGRVYSREEIDRSGATNLGEALQRLDPAIRLHR